MPSELTDTADLFNKSPEQAAKITIHCDLAQKLNFACHQSAFAFLRELQIENNDPEHQLSDLRVTLSSNPGFLKTKEWRLDRIAPGETKVIVDRDIELDGNFLLKLSDAMRGTVNIAIVREGVTLCEKTEKVELLAHNEWGGSGYMPALLAAFSMPNDPAVDRILHDASLILRKAGKPDGIDGYKSGSRTRVWEIARAIYKAIANLGITYSLPPASFERNGQKIRPPNQILDKKVATCLDSAMLFASTLEQAGLNPIVAMPEEHAMAGVWLQPEGLTDIVTDDAQVLRKRIQLKELILIETTCSLKRPVLPFSKALKMAEKAITEDKDDTFDSAVDIHRARSHQINPLGLTLNGVTKQPQEEEDATVQSDTDLEEVPDLPDFDQGIEGVEKEGVSETPEGRLERWQRKLLDLSARNPLLNHKSEKTSLNLICPDPGLLEDKLSEGVRISIKEVPEKIGEIGQDEQLHRQRTGEEILEEYAREVLEKKQVLVNLPKSDLTNRAVNIYRKAQTALQEGGANTLYLGLGFLLWRRNEKDQRKFRAPLILLPVTLERKSVRSGIKMLAHDDEPRFNTTLLELLRQDYSIDIPSLKEDLPQDDSGLDVAEIWNKVRQAVKEVPGFEVTEDVVLGHFSFAKYLMWKDLVDRTDALRKNRIVKHLLDTPREAYTSEISFVDRNHIDRDYLPKDLLTPLPADSSQLAAIATADRGKNFIIIGPPGTGKSQTISNLIAHMLGKGKTVLFVSEKIAALSVVHRRLNKIGLGRFCLELHSNKASKLGVMEQLRKAWNSSGNDIADDWKKKSEQMRVLRDKLNSLPLRLNTPRRNGMTAHDAIGKKIQNEGLAARISFRWPTADHHDEKQLDALREAVKKLQVQAKAVQKVSGNHFRLVDSSDWSPQWEEQMAEQAGFLAETVVQAQHACKGFIDAIGIEIAELTLVRVDTLAELAAVLRKAHCKKEVTCALGRNGAEWLKTLEELVAHLGAYADATAALSCAYKPESWRRLNGDEITRRWQEANEAWIVKKFFAQYKLLRDMRAGGAQGKPDPSRDGPTLARLRKERRAIDRLSKQLRSYKGWDRCDTDPEEAPALQNLHDLGQRARTAINKAADNAEQLADIFEKIGSLVSDNNDLLAAEAPVGRKAQEFCAAEQALRKACEEFEALSGKGVRDSFAQRDATLDDMRKAADTIAEKRDELKAWCDWCRRRTEAMDLDLGPLVEAVEQGSVPTEEIIDSFEVAYCAWWSSAVIGEDEVLRTFSSPEHIAVIEDFHEIDDKFQELTADYIAMNLAADLPGTDSVKRNSSWGILNHELNKQKRHKPVRKLLQEIPDALTQLTPCMMMSPLSVAQYLSADQDLFDVVIFDEASQIPVWDAIGALARGKQVIIAGDPKQMPPTNFFTRTDDDLNGDIDTEGDLESILDEMLGASIPKRELNLHYRSRRESLIAFSNKHYYGNGLITFPAPKHPDEGVTLIKPKGFYARGEARHNQGEAKAIVKEILQRLTHDDPEVRKLTIGVVTFNTEQQSLIENLLDNARSKDPSIEWAFSTDSCLEPVFVKNLETVQGDERDVILFSITYGPDQSGHITMNFGPLNREGGERRLNVAMTRAREEMLVFSTLDPDRIDLSRSGARAVADLKGFLKYAKLGPDALGSTGDGSIGDFESPFEIAVARALRDKRWTVHPQVGVSAYRIDLGIVHPDKPGRYLAGVECDGAMYHSSKVARERDKIRQTVVENLGWTLRRVWSTDWWNSKKGEIDKLDASLQELLQKDRERHATE